MPPRNLILLPLAIVACLAAWLVRERDAQGRRFNEVVSLVMESHLDPVEEDALFVAAVDGVVSQLDEHSAFLRGDDRADLEAMLDQEFAGVGLELAIDERSGETVVLAPLAGGPAARAGIVAGERITAIDDRDLRGLSLAEVVRMLRGKPGESVSLRVVAAPTTGGAGSAARSVTLVRDVVQVENVLGDRRRPDGTWDWMLEGEPGVGLVRIVGFGERTAADVEAALRSIAAQPGLRGVVIDLRGNPGGLLSAAVEVCDLLLDEGVIVSTRGRRDAAGAEPRLEIREAQPGRVLADVPLVVLIDGLTASAAEIVAACLQDSGRARVVGSRSYGKGTVQSILPLSDGRGLLKLTTSEYLRPGKVAIHRRQGDGDGAVWGVLPDRGLEIAPTAEALDRLQTWRRNRDFAVAAGRRPPREVDRVLARAVDALPAGAAGDAR
jgi:carboxyl-terminal processing protease